MRKQICPIGLECINKFCPNYRSCNDLTMSWEIPYRTRDGTLVVKQYGWRYDWDDEGHGTRVRCCPLPSGYYRALYGSDHNDEMNKRLREAWAIAGWVAAVPIDEKPMPEEEIEAEPVSSVPEEDIDSIPF